MKTKIIFFLSCCMFAFLIFHFSFCFGQWEWQNPKPQGNTLNDVFFINQDIGWAVGDAGTIIKSEDGGLNYEVINYPVQSNLFSVVFFDMLHGISVGESGTILKTSDGGYSWSLKEIGLTENLKDVSIIGPDKAWIAGDNGTILYSGDNGDTWQIQHSDTLSSFNSVCFTDASHGWAAGWCSQGSAIFNTADGGDSWELQYVNDTCFSLESICFVDSLFGWVVGTGFILHTNNGGNTWEAQILPPPGGVTPVDFLSVFFIDQNHGCVVGNDHWIPISQALLSLTEDGGTTWNGGNIGDINLWFGLNSVFFADPDHGWAAGSNGNLIRTTDGGQNWTVTCAAEYGYNILRDIFFTDAENGWAVGGSQYPSFSTILHTDDGGSTWTEQEAPSNYLHSVYFINSLEGWIAGGWTWGNSTNIILHTINGGLLWEMQYSHNAINGSTFRDIWFTDDDHGWAIGGEEQSYPPNGPPIIIHTENGGENWNDFSNLTDKSLSAVCFTDQDNGWIAGHEIILHTTDAGQNWEELWTGVYSWIDICFVDNDHGWALGDSLNGSPARDMVMRTTDGGFSWEENFFEGSSYLKKIFFTDIYHGWIVRDGDILYTIDGGITWEHQIINSNEFLAGVFFTDNNNGWVVSENCAILHTENGGIIGDKEQPPLIKHSTFNIQNYPNPFSDHTSIQFNLPEACQVSLKVYDLTGREIRLLVSGVLVSGEHTFTLQAGELQSGIYLYRLSAEDEVVAGKLVVRKE